MKKIFLLGLFLLLASTCLAELVSVKHLPAELRDRAMVSGSSIVKELPRYAPLQILESGAAYLKVKDASGTTGYIHKSLVGSTPAVIVTAGAANVRSGAGTEFDILFTANRGESFKMTGKQQDWVQIETAAGQRGWIWQNLVWGSQ